jgi:hypothetical protein
LMVGIHLFFEQVSHCHPEERQWSRAKPREGSQPRDAPRFLACGSE